MNLCGNAMKFIQSSGVSITADLIKIFDNKVHMGIKVKDTDIRWISSDTTNNSYF